MPRTPSTERDQTRAEEIANSLSHGIGFALAIASLPLLLAFAGERTSAINIVAMCVFSVTMMLLYGVSTLYHAVPRGRAKAWLNRFDHAAIYLFIAGSYTPFVLGVLRGGWGWSLFGVVWGCGLLGFTAKLMNRLRHPLWSTGLYVAMGWVAVVAAAPLVARMPGAGLALLVAGGRRALHRRRSGLQLRLTAALWPFRLASVRARRQRLPFLCGARVRTVRATLHG